MTHALKTWPEYFKAISSGAKTFELRKNDRPFEVGDIMILQEYDIQKKSYTGDEVQRKITFILRDEEGKKLGLREGYCLISFTNP